MDKRNGVDSDKYYDIIDNMVMLICSRLEIYLFFYDFEVLLYYDLFSS